MPRGSITPAIDRQARLPGAINPAAASRATQGSTASVHREAAPTIIRVRDYSIRHRTTTIRTTWISIRTISTATATPPEHSVDRKSKTAARSGGRVHFRSPKISDHDDAGADIDAAIEIDHVLVAHPDAARRDVGTDGPGFVGAMDAIERRTQIHGAGAERVLWAAFHVPRQIGTSRQHFRRRRPIRPFLLGGNLLDA